MNMLTNAAAPYFVFLYIYGASLLTLLKLYRAAIA